MTHRLPLNLDFGQPCRGQEEAHCLSSPAQRCETAKPCKNEALCRGSSSCRGDTSHTFDAHALQATASRLPIDWLRAADQHSSVGGASSTADNKSSRSIRISQRSLRRLQQMLNKQSRAARPAAGHYFGQGAVKCTQSDWRPADDGRRPVEPNSSATCRKRRGTACSPLLRACRPAAGTRSDSDGCANDGVGVCE